MQTNAQKKRVRARRLEEFRKVLKWDATFLVMVVVGMALAVAYWENLPRYVPTILTALSIAFQLMFAMFFAIIQLAAIFMFLGRARVYWIDPGETGVSFDDYKGNREVVEVSRRIVTLLRGVKQFKQMGGQVSRGLLLVGPPGTGKSYLAQAISTEANLPFCYASAPSFQNMFMGIGNLRVMMIYWAARKKARKHGGAIIFIDELDAIGVRRAGQIAGGTMGLFGAGMGILNELLLQMDPPNIEYGWWNKLLRKLGLRSRKAEQPNVLTIGATNLAHILDPALLRPGRFDRQIVIEAPDLDGRKEVIEYYLAKVKHEPLPLERMASETVYYTPVQLKHVINEAVIIAHFNGRDRITYDDWTMARDTYEFGLRQPIKSMTQDERRRIAYHEAGHCVAMYLLQPIGMPPVKATIVRHGGALGFVAPKPLEERYILSREDILSEIQTYLASRAAERIFLNTEMTGVVADLASATRWAALYLGVWGMGGSLYSHVSFNELSFDPSTRQKVHNLLQEQYQRVARLLEDNREAVIAIAEALMERDELDRDEIRHLIEGARALQHATNLSAAESRVSRIH